MRRLFVWLAGAVGMAVSGVGGFIVHASIPIPPTPPRYLLASPLEPVRPELLSQCRTEDDVAAITLPGQVYMLDLQFAFGKKFAPVTGIILVHHNYDGELVMGWVFSDGCIGPPIVVTRNVPNPVTGRP